MRRRLVPQKMTRSATTATPAKQPIPTPAMAPLLSPWLVADGDGERVPPCAVEGHEAMTWFVLSTATRSEFVVGFADQSVTWFES